jgi:hypothetical protein
MRTKLLAGGQFISVVPMSILRPALAIASGADPKAFRSGRDFSAWIGLVPQAELERRHKLSNIIEGVDFIFFSPPPATLVGAWAWCLKGRATA